ncbi:MAG: dienelactone hydrolase family protein [Bryobacterales bacterium]|nr:dienelactone hydrolase family protein [Bryobacterales bacterium]
MTTRLAWLAAVTAIAAWAQQPGEAAARQALFGLLKSSPDVPSVEPEIHGRVTEEGLYVEDVSWRAADGESVPAYVIRPVGEEGPLPSVVCLHGSSGSRDSMTTKEFGTGEWTRPGRDGPHIRMLGWARELARRGFMVLAMTQRGLDVRDPPINVQANALLVQGHTAMGLIIGEIRQGLTYLTQRGDAGKIGITGMSFGGITAFYTWLADDRVAAAAPICGGVGSVRSFVRQGRLSYHGTYWWIPDMLKWGDHGEFAAAMAPRPLLVWAPTSDVGMPRHGVDLFRARAEPAYDSKGASTALRILQPPGGHSFSAEAFEAMASFFGEFLR